jgi:hypothetical protein
MGKALGSIPSREGGRKEGGKRNEREGQGREKKRKLGSIWTVSKHRLC